MMDCGHEVAVAVLSVLLVAASLEARKGDAWHRDKCGNIILHDDKKPEKKKKVKKPKQSRKVNNAT